MTTDPEPRTPTDSDARMEKEIATVLGWEKWCRELLGNVRGALTAADLHAAKQVSRRASYAASDLVRRIQDARRFSAGCGKPTDAAHNLNERVVPTCERLKGHSGDCDPVAPPSPAQRLVWRCTDLSRTLEHTTDRLADLALEIDQAVSGKPDVDVPQREVDDIANRLDDVGQDLTHLSAELVEVPTSPPEAASPFTVVDALYVDPDAPDLGKGDGVGL